MNTILNWLDGKKTVIGLTVAVIFMWLQGHIPPEYQTMATAIEVAITGWAGVAITHKAIKGDI